MKLDNSMESKHKNGLLSSTYFMKAVLASYSKVQICRRKKLFIMFKKYSIARTKKLFLTK